MVKKATAILLLTAVMFTQLTVNVYAKVEKYASTEEKKASTREKYASTGEKHMMAVVIDDLGNNMKGTPDIMALNIPLTVAIMPFLSSSRTDAEAAHAAGHEVIVHLPMEPLRGKKNWLGPGALTSDLTDKQVRERVEAAIEQVPYATGINNHMGSKITADERIMRIVLEVCKERGLYYLDSRTTDQSVVSRLANELGVPYAENSLFLDDEYTAMHIKRQFNKAKELIQKNKVTVVIGHVGPPGPYTADELVQAIPFLQQHGQLVYLRDIVKANLIEPEIM